jgi:cystathionine beta-lyase family protein involved in aluminum resistance
VKKAKQETVIRAILKECDDSFIQFIGEVALNVINGNVSISKHYKSKLKKHAHFIRSLASKSVKSDTRRRIILKQIETVVTLVKAIKEHLII